MTRQGLKPWAAIHSAGTNGQQNMTDFMVFLLPSQDLAIAADGLEERFDADGNTGGI
jgi:hypothetical protein